MAVDPRALRPTQAVALLNSTPLGAVLTPRTFRRHREEAGYSIGDDSTVHLVRYVAWLVRKRTAPKPAGVSPEDAYRRKLIRETQRARDQSLAVRDIGELPPVANVERRTACRLDLHRFLVEYFAALFPLRFSQDHIDSIATIQRVALHGGQFAWSMPRGSGKTTIIVCACLWIALYGHRRFLMPIGASREKAQQIASAIRRHIETNDRLLEDFPEVCVPIRKLDGIAARAAGQLYHGQRTFISWSDYEIVLPTIPGSLSSSAIVRTAGIEASIRGAQFVRPDGVAVRPDFVLLDDPQTDESAMSVAQCAARERIISGAVLGLAGPGRKIAAVMACTVIRVGDVADNLLDRKRHPEWSGRRTKMVYAFPTNDKLWDRYAQLRSESLERFEDLRLATDFYAENRAAMDAGASVAWADRFNEDELSAIQHAMNLKLQNEAAFWAEYQSEPPEERGLLDVGTLTAEQIAERLSNVKRGIVPLGASMLTAMVDVQQDLLFWSVYAWSQDFTGWCVDYDAFPEQHSEHFTLRNAKRTLAAAAPGAGVEGALHKGLETLLSSLLDREWLREDGAPMRVSLCLVDANWDVSTAIVYQVCRHHPHSAQLLPSHGFFVGPGRLALTERKKQLGDRVGLEWRVPGSKGNRRGRHIVYDTNFWKTFVHSRLGVTIGDPGALTLFGNRASRHRMFSEHMAAETRERVQGAKRVVDVWTLRPGRDNHWLDTSVGCAVAASVLGAALPNMEPVQARKKRRRVSVQELQERRRRMHT